MEPRHELMLFGAAGWLAAIVLGVGIFAWGWSPILLLPVAFLGGPILAVVVDWLTSDARRERREQRKRARLEHRHRAVSAH